MVTDTAPAAERMVEIDSDQRLHLDAPSGCIHVAHGSAWLTEAGSLHDTVLAAGDHWPLQGREVLLSALAPTRLHIVGADGVTAGARAWLSGVSGVATPARRLARAWRQLQRAARRQVQRLQFGPAPVPPWA